MVQKFEEAKGLKEFTKRCLMNEEFTAYKGSIEIILQYWEQAESLETFRKMVLSDERLKNNQGYAELSKESRGHRQRVKEMLKDKMFDTYSDAGSVKVMNDNFSVNISNEYGDGVTHCAVLSKTDRFNSGMMNFSRTTIRGTADICRYDCGSEPIKKLDGEYLVYTYEGIVVFKEF